MARHGGQGGEGSGATVPEEVGTSLEEGKEWQRHGEVTRLAPPTASPPPPPPGMDTPPPAESVSAERPGDTTGDLVHLLTMFFLSFQKYTFVFKRLRRFLGNCVFLP